MKLNRLVSTSGMDHATWLEYRKKGIGGSDAGSICGLNPYATAISVYQDKTQEEVTEKADNESMRQGRDLEEYVARRFMAKAVLVAQKKIEERDKVIEEQRLKIEADKPKTIFADAVSASNTSILIGDLAKLICQNGVQTGQKRLFEWMRENGYLIKSGSSRNMPTQKAADMGLFEVKETTITNPDGSVRVTRTTKVTGKGQQYFINKFLG